MELWNCPTKTLEKRLDWVAAPLEKENLFKKKDLRIERSRKCFPLPRNEKGQFPSVNYCKNSNPAYKSLRKSISKQDFSVPLQVDIPVKNSEAPVTTIASPQCSKHDSFNLVSPATSPLLSSGKKNMLQPLNSSSFSFSDVKIKRAWDWKTNKKENDSRADKPLIHGIHAQENSTKNGRKSKIFCSLSNAFDTEQVLEQKASSSKEKYQIKYVDSLQVTTENLTLRVQNTAEINFSHQSIGDKRAILFAQCIKDFSQIQHLNLADNRLTDKSLAPILKNLELNHRNKLLSLNIGENKIDMEGTDALKSYISSSNCALISLGLSKADIDDQECCNLFKLIYDNIGLTSLDLSHNMIGKNEKRNVIRPGYVTGPEAIAKALSCRNFKLQHLNLSWNFIRSQSAVAVGKALSLNEVLTELNLAYNSFGQDGSEEIGKALFKNTSLTVLDMSQNNITPRAAFVIAVALRFNEGLHRIDLSNNQLGEYGGKALMALSYSAHHHIEIGLHRCRFSYKDLNCWFNPENPDGGEKKGQFELDMNTAYDLAVMLDILRLASREDSLEIVRLVCQDEKGEAEVKLIRGRVISDFSSKNENINCDETFGQLFYVENMSLEHIQKQLNDLKIEVSDEDISSVFSYFCKEITGVIGEEDFREIVSHLIQLFKEKNCTCRTMVSTENSDIAWRPPPGSKIKLDIVFTLTASDTHDVFTKNHHNYFSILCNHTDDRTKMTEFTLGQIKLQPQEAQLMFEILCQEYGSKIQAATTVLSSMARPEYARIFFSKHFDKDCMKQFFSRKGSAIPVHLGITCGHHKFDLSKREEHLAFKKLIQINNKEKSERKDSGSSDTSQHGNWDNFRNVQYNDQEMKFVPAEFKKNPPTVGTIELDYVNTSRPPVDTTPLPINRLCDIYKKMGLLNLSQAGELRRIGSLEPIINSRFVPTFQVFGKQTFTQLSKQYSQNHGKLEMLAPSLIKLHKSKTLIKGRKNRLHMMLSATYEDDDDDCQPSYFAIALVLADYYFTSHQIRFLLVWFTGTSAEKLDIAVLAFSRLIDLRNFDTILELFDYHDQANIISRIGMLNIFNPCKPDHVMELDLERREERQVAKVFVLMAAVEPGIHLLHQTFRHSRLSEPLTGGELTKEWLEEERIPTRGILSFEYFSGEGRETHRYRSVEKLRLVLTQLLVLCEVNPETRIKYSSLPLNKKNLDFWVGKANSNFNFFTDQF